MVFWVEVNPKIADDIYENTYNVLSFWYISQQEIHVVQYFITVVWTQK
jgi:hypothetical protein